MKLVTYSYAGRVAPGALVQDRVVDLSGVIGAPRRRPGADGCFAADLLGVLAGNGASLSDARRAVAYMADWPPTERASALSLPVGDVELLAPLRRPGKVVCVGLNYRSHLAEIGEPEPAYPILFLKPSTSIIGQGEAIVLPRVSRQVDYEGELAVVIGRRAKYVPEADALSYVAGYTCANDISAHDLEFRTSQWDSGKMCDTFCPLGPVLVTADEVPDPGRLRLRTSVNGRTVQDASTADMVFSMPFLISYVSSLATLEPGDVILTGTPAGVGCNRRPQTFLRPGDRVGVRIDGLGTLTNPVVAEEGC
jgi:acylpyruvate hydrolase